jgi:hypothetical protein
MTVPAMVPLLSLVAERGAGDEAARALGLKPGAEARGWSCAG